MSYDRWEIALPDEAAVASLESGGYGKLASRTLAQRGLCSAEEADAFLRTDASGFHSPFLFCDMQKAAERVRTAAARKETVAVYGDYDADGLTAACLMVRTLREMGLEPLWHIPDRERDGYGLNEAAVEELYKKGATLIITVDTGTTAFKEVEKAAELGADVIITDHHECRETLPKAFAVINTRLPGSGYPFSELAGVGVAFKFASALFGGWRAPLVRYADLTALGTVADVMTIKGENRLLVSQGLKAMEQTKNAGLRALIAETGLAGKRITAESVAYTLAPRINAAGRVGHANTALELLLTDDVARAGELAREVCELNTLRQSRENEIFGQVLELADPSASAMVAAREGWSTGVAGIAAARLAERFERPAFVLAIEGDMARGSARGVAGVNLAEMLGSMPHLLETFGGHELAAGLSLRTSNLEAFRRAVQEACAGIKRGERVLKIDAEICAEWLDMENLTGLEALAPFGSGFAPPLFCLRGVKVSSPVPIGGGKHTRFVIESGRARLDSVWFNHKPEELLPRVDVAFVPEINRFKGRSAPQLRVVEIREAGESAETLDCTEV